MVGIGSNLTSFVDPPSLLIIFSFTLGVLWIAGALIGTMFSALFSASSTPEQLAALPASHRIPRGAITPPRTGRRLA